MISKCVVCGKTFESRTIRAKYCSKVCSNHSRYTITKHELDLISKAKADEALKLKQTGRTYREIAEIIGMSKSFVSEIYREHGIADNHENKANRNNKIIQDRKSGLSMRQCAEKYGLTQGAIHSICKKHGVTGKTDGWRGNPEIRCCKNCGNAFVVEANIAKEYCSEQCRKSESHKRNDIKRRILKKSAIIDHDITVTKVYRLNDGICYLCGEKCDWTDYVIVNGQKRAKSKYPSVEHIVALVNGGTHSWDNVKLAHMGCNASKGVKSCG